MTLNYQWKVNCVTHLSVFCCPAILSCQHTLSAHQLQLDNHRCLIINVCHFGVLLLQSSLQDPSICAEAFIFLLERQAAVQRLSNYRGRHYNCVNENVLKLESNFQSSKSQTLSLFLNKNEVVMVSKYFQIKFKAKNSKKYSFRFILVMDKREKRKNECCITHSHDWCRSWADEPRDPRHMQN